MRLSTTGRRIHTSGCGAHGATCSAPARTPAEIKEPGRLNRYAVAARYPGTTELVSTQEHQAALAIASSVVARLSARSNCADPHSS